MSEIKVIKGVRYTPEMFLKRMARSKRLENIKVRHMNTLYSLCWIFQLRIAIRVTKKTTRYAGYYAGFDEIAMTPGKLAMLPSWELSDVLAQCVLQDKLTEDQALERTWEYNKNRRTAQIPHNERPSCPRGACHGTHVQTTLSVRVPQYRAGRKKIQGS